MAFALSSSLASRGCVRPTASRTVSHPRRRVATARSSSSHVQGGRERERKGGKRERHQSKLQKKLILSLFFFENKQVRRGAAAASRRGSVVRVNALAVGDKVRRDNIEEEGEREVLNCQRRLRRLGGRVEFYLFFGFDLAASFSLDSLLVPSCSPWI